MELGHRSVRNGWGQFEKRLGNIKIFARSECPCVYLVEVSGRTERPRQMSSNWSMRRVWFVDLNVTPTYPGLTPLSGCLPCSCCQWRVEGRSSLSCPSWWWTRGWTCPSCWPLALTWWDWLDWLTEWHHQLITRSSHGGTDWLSDTTSSSHAHHQLEEHRQCHYAILHWWSK